MNSFPTEVLYDILEEFVIRHVAKLKRVAPEEIPRFLSALETIDEVGLNILTDVKIDELVYDPSSPIYLGLGFCVELEKFFQLKLLLKKLEYPDSPEPRVLLGEIPEWAYTVAGAIDSESMAAASSPGLLYNIYGLTPKYMFEATVATPVLILYLSSRIPKLIKEINDNLNSH